ncbi:DUF4328 domain-containing protein [Kaarinaea lacus]
MKVKTVVTSFSVLQHVTIVVFLFLCGNSFLLSQSLRLGAVSWMLASNVLVALMYLLAGVLYMLWFYKVYRLLYEHAAATLRFAPKWVFLGFAIPAANFWLPYLLVVHALKSLSGLDTLESPPQRRLLQVNKTPVRIWWFSHLCYFVLIPLAYVASFSVTGPSRNMMQLGVSLLSYLFVIHTAHWAKRLVATIDGLASKSVKLGEPSAG